MKTVNCSENWRRCWDRTGKEKGPSREKKYHVEKGNELLTNNKKGNDVAGIYKKTHIISKK